MTDHHAPIEPQDAAGPVLGRPTAMKRSLVYHNIFFYRLVMNVLYRGRYRERFLRILDVVGPDVRSVCDLCFGDTAIAEWCRARGIRWTGIDFNHYFCARARQHGFDVIEGDLLSADLPHADVFIMAAALYHFSDQLSRLFDQVLSRTHRFILSEPVRNLASQTGRLGSWAKYVANPGTGDATFRYDEQSLLAALRTQQQRKGFQFRVVSIHRDMLIEVRQ
jgi:hypothetical protein